MYLLMCMGKKDLWMDFNIKRLSVLDSCGDGSSHHPHNSVWLVQFGLASLLSHHAEWIALNTPIEYDFAILKLLNFDFCCIFACTTYYFIIIGFSSRVCFIMLCAVIHLCIVSGPQGKSYVFCNHLYKSQSKNEANEHLLRNKDVDVRAYIRRILHKHVEDDSEQHLARKAN